MLHLARQAVRAVHAPALHDPSRRAAQQPCGSVCSQPRHMARHARRMLAEIPFPLPRRTDTLIPPHLQILQLTSLLPTAEHFSILLRDALKAQLYEMKQLKSFVPSLYSEYLLHVDPSLPASTAQLIDASDAHITRAESDARGPGGDGQGTYARGLGETFGYPGDARKLRERSKLKLWREYLTVHGRNLTLLRYPPFQRLLQVGLPSRLRGELWEVMSGSICAFLPSFPSPFPISAHASSRATDRPPVRKSVDVRPPARSQQGQNVAIDRRDRKGSEQELARI